MTPFPKNKRPGRIATLFAVVSTVTFAPVLLRRYKDAKREGDKLAVADAAVSAAALVVGVAQVLRARKGGVGGPGGKTGAEKAES